MVSPCPFVIQKNMDGGICMDKQKMEYRDILGEQQTREEVMDAIEKNETVAQMFQEFSEELQEELVAFCMGNWGLKITYDPFFKYIFNPEFRPERLSDFLSLLLGEAVEVIDALPNESGRVTEAGSMLITDILVKLTSGSLANIEIQKIGYTFPGQRCACYSSDLLMRQLTRVKKEAKQKNKKFSYKDVKKVYTIVLIEKSASIYWDCSDFYIHRSKQTFDTGLNLDLLQEYIIIPLDVFRKISHNNLSKLEAWLYFIGSDSPKDISRVIEAYPEFKELYNELLMLRYDMKELVGMFDYYRQLLREADEEAVEYMVEEQRKEIEEQKRQIEKNKQEIERQREENERQREENERQREENERQRERIEELEALLAARA